MAEGKAEIKCPRCGKINKVTVKLPANRGNEGK